MGYGLVFAVIWLLWYLYSRRIVLKSFSANEHNKIQIYEPENKQDIKKIVLIFGWGGAQNRHVAKIASMYTDRGIAVIAQTSPMNIFLDQGVAPAKVVPMLLALHNYIQAIDVEKRQSLRVFLHVFSNTGAVITGAVTHTLRHLPHLHPNFPDFRYIIDLVCGIIFDSAPYVVALNHVTVPKDFQLQLDQNMIAKPLEATPITPAEEEIFNIMPSDDEMTSLKAIAKHSFGFSFSAVSLILKQNKYVHWFWTPAATTVIFIEYMILRFSRFIQSINGIKFSTSRFPDALDMDYANPCKLPKFSMEDYLSGKFPSTPFSTAEMALEYLHSVGLLPKNTGYIAKSSNPKSGNGNHETTDTVDTTIYPNLYCIQDLFDMLFTTVRYPVQIPELFVYSNKDLLIKRSEVEKLIYIHSKRGMNVFNYNFKDSIHVGHFIKYTEKYTDVVFQFMKNAEEIIDKQHKTTSKDTLFEDLQDKLQTPYVA